MLPDASAAPTAGTRATFPAGPQGQTVADPAQVPDVVAPPPRHPRFALIDGMRAIAVLSVVGVHAAVAGEALSSSLGGRAVAHLNIGVTIFFLISGFLLYRPFIAHRGAGAQAPKTADYAKRRFLRIYPAYWVALTVLVVVPGLTGVVSGNWLAMYSLGHTLPLYEGRTCTEATFECGLAHTWSLVIEVTFYAALPLWAYAVARLTDHVGARHWIRVELLALAAMSVVSVALGYVIFDPVPDWIDGSVVGYGYWFALGMGMAVASVALAGGKEPAWAKRLLGIRPEVPWLLALAGYAILCAVLPATPFLFAQGDALVAHLSFGLIAALLLAPAVFAERTGGLPRRLLATPTAAWLGLVSYGIFLWHYAVTLELGFPGADWSFAAVLAGTLAITVPIAAASYYLVERPLLRFKYRRLRPGSDR